MTQGCRRLRQRSESSVTSASSLVRTLTVSLALCCALVLNPSILAAQGQQTTRGTEFWVAFMENLGSGRAEEVSDLRLYMASDSVTTVYVRFLPIDDTLAIELRTPGLPVELRINEWLRIGGLFSSELKGVGPNGEGNISDLSFHITADDEITLYGANLRTLSADAFLTLPDNVLSGSYFVLGYQNGFSNVEDGTSVVGYDTHSEFAVVATEDNTEVTIYPTAPLLGHVDIAAPESFTVVLNRGEVYFGQAVTGDRHDVTGTEINSTKPIALFAGNQRTAVPTEVGNFRDHLVEQMPPLEAWGREAYLTPHVTVDPRVTEEAIARIVASSDGTFVRTTTHEDSTVTRDDGSFADTVVERDRLDTLNRGEVLEMRLQPARILATEPILVAQYEHSVGGDPYEKLIGDPFMMLIPPPTQFDRSYPFQSIVDSGVDVHYVNVVIETGSESSLRIDGSSPWPRPVWKVLPGGEYLWAQIQVSSGAHRIEADGPFGLAAYGFGRAMSYGYIGASLFRDLPIDFSRPDISISEACDYVYGTVHDSTFNDRGIDSVYATSNSSNIRLVVDEFDSGDSSASWRATLVDPSQDGLLELRVIDRAGRSSTERVGIPGLTLAIESRKKLAGPELELISYNGEEACADLVIFNYGKHPRRIESLRFEGSQVLPHTIDVTLPTELQPGDTLPVRLCTPGIGFEPVDLKVVLGGTCLELEIATLVTGGIQDTTAPFSELDVGQCGAYGRLRFAEEKRRFFGVASITVESISNGRWHLEPDTLPTTLVDMIIDPIDIREDVIVSVSATDLAGNTIRRIDTIGGFTVAVHDSTVSDPRLSVRLGEGWTGEWILLQDRQCDSILLKNYGATRVTIERAFMSGNQYVSIPPAQLPLSLNPGEEIRLRICREGGMAADLVDTLKLEDRCGRWEYVALRSPIRPIDGFGRDECGQLIATTSYGPAKRSILSAPFPNPAVEGIVHFDIGLVRDDDVRLELFNENGDPARLLWDGPAKSGLHRLTFDVTDLPSGSYHCSMTVGNDVKLSTRLIISR